MRAIYAALPEKFDNDAKGDKAAWREAILQSIQSKCKALPWSGTDDDVNADIVTPSEEEINNYIVNIPRNPTYRYCTAVFMLCYLYCIVTRLC